MAEPRLLWSIPEYGFDALKLLLNLGKDGIEELSASIQKTGPILASARKRALLICEDNNNISLIKNIEIILDDFLFPIAEVRREFYLTPLELHSEVSRALHSAPPERWPQEYQQKWGLLTQGIVSLLGNETLAQEMKGRFLLESRPNRVKEVKIFSDTRPSFDESGFAIQADLLMNTLYIRFGRANESRTAYFSLDPDDLENLKDQVERARNKNKEIEEFHRRKNIPITMFHREDTKDERTGSEQ